MKKFPISLLCGIAAIVATIIVFFTILGNAVLEAIHFITLIAIILAEIITTVYALCAKGSPRRIAAAGLTAIMVPFSVILSVVYIVNFPNGYGTYLGWYFAITILVNALALILVFFDSRKNCEDSQLQRAKSNMLYLRKLVKCVMVEESAKPYETKLRALEEKLHFSNDSVILPEDEDIGKMLVALQENIGNPEFDTAGLLSALEKAVQRRTITTSRNV